MGFLTEEKAQVSAELLIVIAAVIAVAIIFITQLIQTGEKGQQRLEQGADTAFDKIDAALGNSSD